VHPLYVLENIMNKFIFLSIVVLASAILSGCLSNEITGIYVGEHDDMLLVRKNGELLWSPMSKTQNDFVPVGMLGFDRERMKVQLVTASASQHLGTELTLSEDYREISVRWAQRDDVRRSAQYRKQS